MNITHVSNRTDGWWYPWIFVAVFMVVFSVNGILVYFALSTATGQVTQDAFQEGRHFNARLAQKAAQVKLGWRSTLTHQSIAIANASHAQSLRLHFADAKNHGVNALSIKATAVRPTQIKYDRALTFTPQGNGVYTAHIKLPAPGIWDIHVTARRANEVFKLIKRIRIP